MKKLILLLLFIPLVSFSQNSYKVDKITDIDYNNNVVFPENKDDSLSLLIFARSRSNSLAKISLIITNSGFFTATGLICSLKASDSLE